MDLRAIPERRHVMTFALAQGLEMLQMPQQELAQWLMAEIEKNPLLELDESNPRPRLEADIPSTPTLYETLIRQIHENISCPEDQKIAEELLQHLDEKGFITIPLNAQQESILAILQTFDPPGICARNLQESLLIQLKIQGKAHSAAFRLIETSYNDLLHGRYTLLKKKTDDLASAIQTISRLRLRPGEEYKKEPITYAIADLDFSKTEEKWSIDVEEGELPKFQIQKKYLALHPTSIEEKESLRTFKTQADWIVRSLKRRRKLLSEIGKILVKKQAAFLDQTGPLAPVTAQEISNELGVHESTISRALAGKYATTPRGLIPLRDLVTATPETESAREFIQKWVETEDKQNPYTDDQLANMLKEKGYEVARRTVSKYRSQLKIGSANMRKHLG
jgi:RNA polymerase sigma-54 factor